MDTRTRYASNIVAWFDRRPEYGIDVAVDDVLAQMDTWVDRHTVAKAGVTTFMSDLDRQEIVDVIRVAGAALRSAADAHARSGNAVSRARRAGGDGAAELEAARAARDIEIQARRDGQRVVVDLLRQHPEHQREIELIAARCGFEV